MPECGFCQSEVSNGVLCESCEFWSRQLGYDIGRKPIIIGGWYYKVGTKMNKTGSVACIRRNNGEWIETEMLETVGKIPEQWKKLMPDTAVLAYFK